MRILVHDYAGHAFPVTLSRALAHRGHEVLHVFSQATHTPRGELELRVTDPANFNVHGIELGRIIRKDSFFERFRIESDYGKRIVNVISNFHPEVVLSGQTPSIPQNRLARYCQSKGVRLVSWIQDMYGVAAHAILKRKLWGVGQAVGQYFMWLDKRSAELSDQIIVITDDFAPTFERFAIPRERIHVIHNWGPLDSLPLQDRDNEWSQERGLGEHCRFLYSGTLAMKHNPRLLLELARRLDLAGLGELIVISEGAGIDWLRGQAHREGLNSLRTMRFQPFERLAEVLASGDVLLSILEPEAGEFCVPSKVLSYMCAGRAQLAAMPDTNLATRLIADHRLGLTSEPTDTERFVEAALQLASQASMRRAMGRRARAFAEKHFDINRICDRFCSILGCPTKPSSSPGTDKPTLQPSANEATAAPAPRQH